MTTEQIDGLARDYINRIIETQKRLGRPAVPSAAKRAAIEDVQHATRKFSALAKKQTKKRGARPKP
jgi:hypothetical protein